MSDVLARGARLLHRNHMQALGIANSMRLAHAYNRRRYRRQDRYRREQYERHFDELLLENGSLPASTIRLEDGWAIDTSGSLPFLNDLLKDAEEVVAERDVRRKKTKGEYRSFFQELQTPEDAERYPSFLNFATSNPVLSAVCAYLKTIPVLSTTIPPGIRFVESSAEFDDRPHEPQDSQLYHIDYYSKPDVYVIVLLHDTTREHGPFCFLPLSTSQDAVSKLKYWKRNRPYRLPDQEVYSVVDPGEMIEFTYPKGSVLFIDPSACFHYGSRNSVRPRYHLMYGYHLVCRTDLSEFLMTPTPYPMRHTDSQLRRMILDRNYMD